MLRPSWNAPSLVAPSPMKATATRPCPSRLHASASPVVSGMLPPTMAMAGIMPTVMSPTCIEPPLPLQQPVRLAYSSAMIERRLTPLAIAWPCGRCVEVA